MSLPASEREQVNEFLQIGTPSSSRYPGSEYGERMGIPPTVFGALKRLVALMSQGKSVTLVPDNQVMPTQRAAGLLGMSRPFFVKLLESGAMAHHPVGNQRRVYLRDVLEFERKRDDDREAALDRLSRQALEAGLYDRNVMPEVGADD